MAIPYVNNIDLNNNQMLNMRLQNLAAAPPNPLDGFVYYNTATLTAQLYTSGGWITLGHLGEIFTTALLAKLNGIATGATLVADSTTNGNILINGVQNVVYTHPTGTNPHGTTKADVGLGSVENKSAATILAELSSAQIATSLGFAPRKFLDGLDASKPAATGSKIFYVATDTGKIYLDNAASSWIQVGGQDTMAWANITGKPTTFTPPIATPSLLGGIKVGANLTIDANGVLSANSNPASYIIREEEFIISGGQTTFNLADGTYNVGTNALEIFVNGARFPNRVVTEASSSSFTLPAGLADGTVVFARYLQTINITPYPVHKSEHLAGGTDPIPVATTSADGLMSAVDKVKLDGSYTSAQADAAISTAINALIAGSPGALDTLNELAAAMGDDPNFATTVTNALANKVDKITGKGLSTEDFTTVLLTKLNGIATGAQVNNISAANATDLTDAGDTALHYHAADRNRANHTGTQLAATISDFVATVRSSVLTGLSTATNAAITATDTVLGALGKLQAQITGHIGSTGATHGAATTSVNGFMSSTDKTKLDGVATGANNYTHPANHPPAIITQDASNRFVTDTEKTVWNGKTGKYSAAIGDGTATSIVVTHGLNTQNVTVTLRETASPYNVVMTDAQITSVNTITLIFATAPTAGKYTVTVVG